MLILKASPIHGVGVFTTTPIKKGQKIYLFDYNDWRFIRKPKGRQKRYCIKDKGGYHAPLNFNRMSIGWYMNHSKKPTVYMDGMIGEANRYIRAGEELTVNYKNL